jgi:hypothetical protein
VRLKLLVFYLLVLVSYADKRDLSNHYYEQRHKPFAQVAINTWLRQYNQIRPHHVLNMTTPAPETLLEKMKLNGRI